MVLLILIPRSLPGGHLRRFRPGQRTVQQVVIPRSLPGGHMRRFRAGSLSSYLELEDSLAGLNPQISSWVDARGDLGLNILSSNLKQEESSAGNTRILLSGHMKRFRAGSYSNLPRVRGHLFPGGHMRRFRAESSSVFSGAGIQFC
jgi:hypothetical protein